jgi:tetratricopeptide (TPR) repeat protein
MNDDDPILAELRKISAWADMQRKFTRWTLIFVAVFVAAGIVFGILMEHWEKKTLEETNPRQQADWYDVDRNVRSGAFDKAIQVGEELIRKTPQYPEAHRRLAGAYLATGNIRKAREHYAEAYRLFPSEENEKQLFAIDKRIRAENPQASGSQPIGLETNRTSEAAGSGH